MGSLSSVFHERHSPLRKFSNFCIVGDETDGLALRVAGEPRQLQNANLENRRHAFVGRTK